MAVIIFVSRCLAALRYGEQRGGGTGQVCVLHRPPNPNLNPPKPRALLFYLILIVALCSVYMSKSIKATEDGYGTQLVM